MKYHPVTQQIINILKEKHFWFTTFEHEPVRTSEEAAKVRTGYTLKQGAKALILKVGKKFIMVVLPGDSKMDSKKIKNYCNSKSLRFATPEEVLKITGGVKVGGVPPFGNLFGLEVIADPTLFDNEKIVFNAGDRRFSIAMLAEDYREAVNPKIEVIV